VPTAPADPYAEFGGRQAVEQSHQVMEALRTEAGVRAMIAQGLTALGYTPAQIKAFVEQNAAGAPESTPGAPAAPVDPLAQIADDDLITGADLKGIVGQLVQQTLAQSQQLVQEQVDPVRAQFEQRQQAEAQQVANSTYVELLGPVPDQATDQAGFDSWMARARAVQNQARQFVAEDNWNPADIRAGLIRGHALYEAEQEEAFKAYARAKKADRAGQPTNIRGGAPQGGEPAPEPKNTAEARDIFFREQGIIK
jgi:DNA-binding transcriptional MerR regulator